MERIFMIMLMLLGAIVGTEAQTVVGADRQGDVNSDDAVNSADVVAVYNYITAASESGITEAKANVNGDNAVNSADVVAIYNIIINGPQRQAVALGKQYAVVLSDDILKVADVTVSYIDDNNEVVSERITGNRWSRTLSAKSRPLGERVWPAVDGGLDATDAGLSLNYTLNGDYDTRQVYEIAIEEAIVYNVVYDDGTTAQMPVVNINPQTPAIEGDYVDNAMNAICQTATNARGYDADKDRTEMSDFWENNEQGYVADPVMGGGQQIDPGTVIDYTYDDHEWVDLGLPSGLKWATRNVGARTPYDLGGLYGWGDATGYHTESNNRYYPMSRPDTAYISHTRMDIATVQWGPKWRMPSKDEAEELIDNCTYERKTEEGCEGIWFTSKINGKQIFMPCAGDRFVENIRSVTPTHANGYYWTANLYPTDNAAAYAFHWDGFTNMYKPMFKERYLGCSVRPVLVEEP